MPKVERISISVEAALLSQFERFVAKNGYPTRSEALQSLMRSALVEQAWEKGAHVAATLSLVYDHHKRGVMEKIVDVQHDFGDLIVCTQHVHLDHHHCMEVIVLRGKAAHIQNFQSRLKAVKGIQHASLMMAPTGDHEG